jgi:hypothetical protein
MIVPHEYDHIYLKGSNRVRQTETQVHFYSSLRKGKVNTLGHSKSSAKQFSTIPFKERH